jgi:hypothetical protein
MEAASEWITGDQMRARGLGVFDVRGKRISRIRACRQGVGGVHIRALLFVDVPPYSGATYDATEQNAKGYALDEDGPVEAAAFIRGGVIREVR